MGLRSPLGNTPGALVEALKAGKSGIRAMPEWSNLEGMRARVAGLVDDLGDVKRIPRSSRRSMGRVALLSGLAAVDAWTDAGLTEDDLRGPRAGVAFGSTAGSVSAEQGFVEQVMQHRSLIGMQSSTYLQIMTHTCAANLGVFAGVQGPVIATCSACTSGSQGIGVGYQQIKLGSADIMITGGAEEMHFLAGAVFDIMRATSGRTDPETASRPFDARRDGLVVSEGAGCLVLEEREHARQRGATVHAELVGYGTSCNGVHMTNSDPNGIRLSILGALRDAKLNPDDIGYINAHATATDVGDRAEAEATHEIFGDQVPVSSLKGHMGHTLGASGALESIASILMLKEGVLVHTKNLEHPDPENRPLDHIMGAPRERRVTHIMNNNFAFGGINTSLVFAVA